ncbi:MAG: SCO family protein [Verrucomicrobiota bacterium]|jgi:protein SCO1/2
MSQPSLKIQFLVWGGLSLIVLAVLLTLFVSAPSRRQLPLPHYGLVTDFSLSDQDGRIVSEADWRGQICVVDLIFTRCAGPCPIVSATMKQLQDTLPAHAPVRLVSLTSDPDYDTPAVLKKYGERFGARPGVWTFLTGPKAMMRHLAMEELKLSMVDKPPAERETPVDLVIHSTKLVLLDQQGGIRGYFDGETTGCIPAILAAIQSLRKES